SRRLSPREEAGGLEVTPHHLAPQAPPRRSSAPTPNPGTCRGSETRRERRTARWWSDKRQIGTVGSGWVPDHRPTTEVPVPGAILRAMTSEAGSRSLAARLAPSGPRGDRAQ